MVTAAADKSTKFGRYAARVLDLERATSRYDSEWDDVRYGRAMDAVNATVDRGPVILLGGTHGVDADDDLGARAVLSRPFLEVQGGWEPAIVIGRFGDGYEIEGQNDYGDDLRLTATQLRKLVAWAKRIGFFDAAAKTVCSELDAVTEHEDVEAARVRSVESPIALALLRHLAYQPREERTSASLYVWSAGYTLVDGDPLSVDDGMSLDEIQRTQRGAMTMVLNRLRSLGDIVASGEGEQKAFGLSDSGWARLNRLTLAAEAR